MGLEPVLTCGLWLCCHAAQPQIKKKKKEEEWSGKIVSHRRVAPIHTSMVYYISLCHRENGGRPAELHHQLLVWASVWEGYGHACWWGADFHFQNFSVLFFILFIQDIQFQWVDIRYALSVWISSSWLNFRYLNNIELDVESLMLPCLFHLLILIRPP